MHWKSSKPISVSVAHNSTEYPVKSNIPNWFDFFSYHRNAREENTNIFGFVNFLLLRIYRFLNVSFYLLTYFSSGKSSMVHYFVILNKKEVGIWKHINKTKHFPLSLCVLPTTNLQTNRHTDHDVNFIFISFSDTDLFSKNTFL